MTGLYDPRFERDACGIGLVADANGTATRRIVDAALEGLCGVMHRGAVAADAKSGDGAGLLLPLPRALLARECSPQGVGGRPPRAVDPGRLGAAMCFLEGGEDARADRARVAAKKAVEDALAREGLRMLGWREVPVAPDVLGDASRAQMPHIVQALFARPADLDPEIAERRCFLARKRAEQSCREAGASAYFVSWSLRTVTYKAMSRADQLVEFYPDLKDPDWTAWFAIFHQRYSTNTMPTWERAQPFRFLCHNGEINTIEGNVNLMGARVGRLGADWPELGDEGERLLEPLIEDSNSDSAKLDNVLEFLVRGGRGIDHVMAMLVPQVWEGRRDLPSRVRDFYRYHAALVEPWDGPAGLVFTDGLRVAASLDRNGLRPLRYAVCEDGFVVASSEVGAVSTLEHGTVRRSRLGPGQMVLIDPRQGGVVEDYELKRRLAASQPYGEWLRDHQRTVGVGQPASGSGEDLLPRQIASGYTKEEETTVLRPMATTGKEPVSSMG
ncbi:MAG: glutamate synthase subunit alpha, partial [Egibacteraceae bacterium]